MRRRVLTNLFAQAVTTRVCTIISRSGSVYQLQDRRGRRLSAVSGLYYAVGTVVLERQGIIAGRAQSRRHKEIEV